MRRRRWNHTWNGRASARRRGDPLEGLLDITLGNAAMAAILALLAAAIGRLCRRPALTHALWVLVLIKLLTPPLWKLPMGGVLARAMLTPAAQPQQPPPAPESFNLPPVRPAVVPHRPDSVDSDAVAPGIAVVELPEPIRRALNTEAVADDATSPVAIEYPASTAIASLAAESTPYLPVFLRRVLYLAGAGSIICAIVVATRLARFVRLLRYATPAPPPIQRRIESLALRMGVAP